MRPTRRSTLGLALGGAALLGTGLGGCDLDRGDGGPSPAAAPAADPDRALVDGVLLDLDARLSTIASARAAFPRLGEPLAALETMHLAHRAALDPGTASAPGAPPAAGTTARAAARTVRTDEEAHRLGLVEAAVAARSGALARLLGSAAASVAQHLAALPADLGRRPDTTAGPVPSAAALPPAAPATPRGPDLEALRTTLAAEHAAVHVHGVLGARTSESASPVLFAAVRDAYAEHRDRRDELVGRIAAAGGEPVPAAVAYAVPTAPAVPGATLDTPAGIAAIAAALEAACATTYAAVVGTAAAGEVRRLAIGWLGTAAVRELAFRGTPEMFPGAGEHADR